MTRVVFASVLCSMLALAGTDASAAGPLQRYALIVGANAGGANRPQLQYAIADAERFARVLVDLGGVTPANQIVLRQPKLKELIDALDTLTRRVTDARRVTGAAAGRTEIIVYYSGHADEQGLLLGDDRYSYRTLRDRLDQIPADVRIAVLDACSSGAFTRMKGGRARPAFLVDESADMHGHAFLTSSAETEAAQESDRIRASYFTHYLISGFRGRAAQELQRRAGRARRRLAVWERYRVKRPDHEPNRLVWAGETSDEIVGASPVTPMPRFRRATGCPSCTRRSPTLARTSRACRS